MRQLITYIFLLGAFNLTAQDIHFTMYDAMPTVTNPATTGVFNGGLRAVMNYKNQWATIGSPYNTYSVMLDGSLLKDKWRNGYLGAGLNFYKDVAGTTKFGTTKISLALSSVLYLSDKTTASIGFLGSWAQNSISPNNLEWDSQFNGQTFDASAPSNEIISFGNDSYFDFSAGGLWAYGNSPKTLSSEDGFNFKIGAAFYHVARPSRDVQFGDPIKLYSKFTLHTESHIGISDSKLALEPKFIAYLQGPARQFTGGLLFRYSLREESKYTGIFTEMAISAGAYYRFGDALAPAIELQISKLSIGFAYDINISSLTPASNGNGGPEIFIRFINTRSSYGRGTRSSARFR